MDYKKKYEQALAKAKNMIDDLRKGEDILAVSELETMFPELVESDDERIRKALIEYHKNHLSEISPYIERADIIAWLEKQGMVTKDAISMDVNSETEWDDIHKFLRMNLDGEKVKLLIIREE